MILDKALLFSDAQAITAAAASTDYADLGSARDLGLGENLYVAVTVDVAFTDAGSDSTLTVALESDSATSFAATLLSTTLFTIPALAPIGAKYYARISPDAANQRYIRLYFTPNNGNLTTGSVTAAIVKDIDKQINYPKGYVIN